MSDTTINGLGYIRDEKRIHELEDLIKLKDDAYMVLDQDNLTRKVTLLHLRLSFIADEAHESKFYTSEMIDNKIDEINKKILQLSSIINKFPSSFNDIINDIDDIKQNIDDIRTAIDEINNRLDNLYGWGTSIPSTLETGKLYFQYFVS